MTLITKNSSLDYFSVVAHAFHDCGLMDQLGLETFKRQWLKSPNPIKQEGIFAALAESCPDYFQTARLYFGEAVFLSNFARFTLRAYKDRLDQSLAKVTGELSQRAELLFNQPISLFNSDSCDHNDLFANHLIVAAEQIIVEQQCLNQSSRILYEFTSTLPPNNGDRKLVDMMIAHLQFASESRSYQAFDQENRLLSAIACHGSHCLALVTSLMTTVEANFRLLNNYGSLAVAIKSCQGHLARLDQIKLDPAMGLVQWGQQLEEIVSALEVTTGLINRVAGYLREAITLGNLETKQQIPQSLFRYVAVCLLRRGKGPNEAEQASKKLAAYCHINSIPIRRIDPLEANRIDPNLDRDTMLSVKKIDLDQSLNVDKTVDKDSLMGRIQSLRKSLSQRVSPTLLALICIVFASCGIKTAPRSNVVDLRPKIPYKTQVKKSPSQLKDGNKLKKGVLKDGKKQD